jgi:phosphoserine phosphatase
VCNYPYGCKQGCDDRQFYGNFQNLDVDISFQEDNMFRRNRRLVCFDMDSTLIQTEVIDELADLAGVGEQGGALQKRRWRNDFFKESFKQPWLC